MKNQIKIFNSNNKGTIANNNIQVIKMNIIIINKKFINKIKASNNKITK